MDHKQDDYIYFIVTNDKKGLSSIYKNFLPRIKSLITSNGGSNDDALDIFQDAILIIYEKVKEDDFELKSQFYTLLHGICRNLWGNRLQKKSFKEVTIPEDIKYKSDHNIVEAMLRNEESMIFWSNFKKLGEDCQKLLTLFFEKIKMNQITEEMGYGSLSYTKKRKFQCKEKLVSMIKSDSRYIELMKE
jgi:RNA polymerase sigma factor (sigma-70 family)